MFQIGETYDLSPWVQNGFCAAIVVMIGRDAAHPPQLQAGPLA
jgi:hypothetical protein